MPARISPEKENKIVELYLKGVSESEIATSCDVSQSTVSEAISRFKKEASETSLDGASRSRGLLHQVDELRSLSADLKKAGGTIDEAKMGCKLIEELTKIGADLDTLESLLAVYRRISPKDFPTDEFVQATTRMILLEKQHKMSYNDIVSTYEHTQPKLIQLNKDIETKTQELQEITKKRNEAEADLPKRLEENRITLGKVQSANAARAISWSPRI